MGLIVCEFGAIEFLMSDGSFDPFSFVACPEEEAKKHADDPPPPPLTEAEKAVNRRRFREAIVANLAKRGVFPGMAFKAMFRQSGWISSAVTHFGSREWRDAIETIARTHDKSYRVDAKPWVANEPQPPRADEWFTSPDDCEKYETAPLVLQPDARIDSDVAKVRAEIASDLAHPVIVDEPFEARQNRGQRMADSMAKLIGDDAVIELRAPKWGRFEETVIARFSPGHFGAAARHAIKVLEGKCPAVYVVMNGVSPSAPVSLRMKSGAKAADILRRRWLLIDIDPERHVPEGQSKEVNSTDAEKAAALEVATAIRAELASRGWPEPVQADSGNGWHLLYRIDLPNDDASTDLVRRDLAGLKARFPLVDSKVSDAPRLVKLHGTYACKGPHTDERPGRFSSVLSIPSEIAAVPLELLTALAEEAPKVTSTLIARADCASPSHTFSFTASERTDAETRYRLWLEKAEPSVSHQAGHAKLLKAATGGVGFGLDHQAIARILTSDFNPRCLPPWSDREIEHKVSEAIKLEPNPGKKLDQDRPGWQASSPKSPPLVDDSVAGLQEYPPRFSGPVKPLRPPLAPVPEFPKHLLPEPFGEFCFDIADRTTLPIEYPAVTLMVALSSLIGRKLGIRPKRNDDWLVIPNCWGMIVGVPGRMKSPAIGPIHGVINDLQDQAKERHDLAMEQYVRDKQIANAKAAKAQAELKKKVGTVPDLELQGIAGIAAKPEQMKAPTRPRYIVNDATPEALIDRMGENPNGLMEFRDELVGLFRGMEKQGREQEKTVYLESWSGNGRVMIDRVGRGTMDIRALCLSVFGTIQPGPLFRMIKTAAARGEVDGFIPRFQLMVFPDAGEPRYVDRSPDRKARDRAFEAMRMIDDIDKVDVGGLIDPGSQIRYIHFDGQAQELFAAWYLDNARKVASGIESEAMSQHLAKYSSLMPSLALIFHVIDSITDGEIGPVTLDAANRAAAWCDLLEQHARRIYLGALDGSPESAVHLFGHIKAGDLPNPFTARQAFQKGWMGLDDLGDLRKALDVLEDRNIVRMVTKPKADPTKGGRPSEEFWVNPEVLQVLEEGR